MKKPPTGEPYAGKPPVRFGGRGGEKPSRPLSDRPVRYIGAIRLRLLRPTPTRCVQRLDRTDALSQRVETVLRLGHAKTEGLAIERARLGGVGGHAACPPGRQHVGIVGLGEGEGDRALPPSSAPASISRAPAMSPLSMRWAACASSPSMRALLGSMSRAVAITGTCGGGLASIGAGLGCSTLAVTNCAALSGGFSTGRTRSIGRTGTRTVLTSATFVSGAALASAAGGATRAAAVGPDFCGLKKPLSQSTAGTTIISPAIRPRTAAPICWRNQRSSSWAKGWRQVEGIGIGSSSWPRSSGGAAIGCGAKQGPGLGVGERRKPVLECRRNRALGSGGRDKVGKARQLGVGGRASTVLARLVLGDRSCQQLRQLLRQVADRRSQKLVI